MKKTIIALLALAGVATAEPITEYTAKFTYTGTDTLDDKRGHIILGDESEAITLSSWMIEVEITELGDKGVFFSTYYNATQGSAIVERGGLGITTYTTSGMGISVNGNKTPSSAPVKLDVADFTSISSTSPLTLRFAFNAETDTAYLYNLGTGKYISVGVGGDYDFSSVGSTVTGVGDLVGKSMFWTDGGASTFKLVKVTDMSAFNNDSTAFVSHLTKGAVPEPTTATLSLLALAGLAARRRRK